MAVYTQTPLLTTLILAMCGVNLALRGNASLDGSILNLLRHWSKDKLEPIDVCLFNLHGPKWTDLRNKLTAAIHRTGEHAMVLSSNNQRRTFPYVSERKCLFSVIPMMVFDKLIWTKQLAHWNRFGVSVVLVPETIPESHTFKLMRYFGFTRVFFVKLGANEQFAIYFPTLYREKLELVQPDGVHQWLNFDQQKDMHGFCYWVLFYQNAPYVYRKKEKVYVGADVRFITEMAERQNASFDWTFSFTRNEDEQEDFNENARVALKYNYANTVLARTLEPTFGDGLALPTRGGYCIMVQKRLNDHVFVHLKDPFSWMVIALFIGFITIANDNRPTGISTYSVLASTFDDYRQSKLYWILAFGAELVLSVLGESFKAVIVSYMFINMFEPEMLTLAHFAVSRNQLRASPAEYQTLHDYGNSIGIDMVPYTKTARLNHNLSDRYYVPGFAYVVDCDHAKWTIQTNRIMTEDTFYVVQQKLLHYQHRFTVTETEPIASGFVMHIERFFEGGFWTAWTSLEMGNLQYDDSRGWRGIFDIETIDVYFWVLFYGYALGVICMVLELVVQIICKLTAVGFWQQPMNIYLLLKREKI